MKQEKEIKEECKIGEDIKEQSHQPWINRGERTERLQVWPLCSRFIENAISRLEFHFA